MTKQKFVVKLSLDDAKKRTKALKTAVAIKGVQSVALDGDKLVVVGDGTDAITLTTQLRKKMGYADLISVASGEEKKEEKKEKEKENKKEDETKKVQPLIFPYQYTYPYSYTYFQEAYDHHKFYSIV